MIDATFAYRNLVVYQKAKEYVTFAYSLTRQYPAEERFGLCNQIQRAVVSITSNIAEAMGRYSDKDKLHFIEFAFGSLYETMSQFEISLDLGYINQETFNQIEQRVLDISRMLSGLRKTYLDRISD